jgi:hypothetical protein
LPAFEAATAENAPHQTKCQELVDSEVIDAPLKPHSLATQFLAKCHLVFGRALC